MLAAAIFALLLAGSADAARDRPDGAGDSMPGVAPGNLGQHGPNEGHLPPVQSNMDLVGKLEVKTPAELKTAEHPEDVAEGQIADLTVFKQRAYLNSWATPVEADDTCKRGGLFVVDISNPAQPTQKAFLPALPGNYHGEGAQVVTIDTPAFSGDVLAVNNEPCGPQTQGGGGFDLWNVTNPDNPTPLTRGFGDFGEDDGTLTGDSPCLPPPDDQAQCANSAHSIFIWNAGDKAYAVSVDNTEFHDVDIFDITNPAAPQPVAEFDLTDATFGPLVWTETANGDTPFHHDVVVKEIGGRQVMLASYWDAGYVQLDVTDPANPTYIADSDFGTVDPLTGFARARGQRPPVRVDGGQPVHRDGRRGLRPIPVDGGRGRGRRQLRCRRRERRRPAGGARRRIAQRSDGLRRLRLRRLGGGAGCRNGLPGRRPRPGRGAHPDRPARSEGRQIRTTSTRGASRGRRRRTRAMPAGRRS